MAELDRPLKKAFSGEGLLADGDAAKARDAGAGLPAGNLWKRHFGNVRRRTWTSSLNAADAYLSTS